MGLNDWTMEQLHRLRKPFEEAGYVEPYEPDDYASGWDEGMERMEFQIDAWGIDADQAVDDVIADVADKIADEALPLVQSAIGEAWDGALVFVRYLIPTLIESVQEGYKAIREGFRGKEPETIAAVTIAVLVMVTAMTLLYEVRTGPAGAGEYMGGNRPPGDGFLGP